MTALVMSLAVMVAAGGLVVTALAASLLIVGLVRLAVLAQEAAVRSGPSTFRIPVLPWPTAILIRRYGQAHEP